MCELSLAKGLRLWYTTHSKNGSKGGYGVAYNRKRSKALMVLISIVAIALLTVFLFSGENFDLLRSLFLEEHTDEELRDKLAAFGVRGYLTIALLSMLQVVITVLPAEPVQVLAGLTFGFPIGLACCAVGVLLGHTVIYLLYRFYGERMRAYFVKSLHLDFEKAATSKKLVLFVLLLYFLPAIPYGMICFFAASAGMKYPRYIAVTTLGAIPSICIGVGLGHMAMTASWILSVCVFAVLVVLLIVLASHRERIFRKINAYLDRPPYSSKTVVRPYSVHKLSFAYVVSRIVLFLRGVRVRYINETGGKVEGPAIVLCNHGSFIDFVYAGSLLRRSAPHFIVARLYFYQRIVGRLLRAVGCFPKSMFAADIESARNCLRVLRSGGVLAMMPEARLSTVGRFEDMQSGTFAFLKTCGVPVYTVCISGDYLADPKWGHGLRRGSYVEARLSLLMDGKTVTEATPAQIESCVTERLHYDELAWLAAHPDVHYRSRTLAEGLENILSLCPKCKQKYTIKTKRRAVYCQTCGKLAEMNDRYAFDPDAPFANFADWYEWQMEDMRARVAQPDFSLTSPVEYCLPSIGGRGMLRTAGRGVCTLDATGLHYEGTLDGEHTRIDFPMKEIYRLLFGAGEDFEIYRGTTIHYFRPDERRAAVDFYMASMLLSDQYHADNA